MSVDINPLAWDRQFMNRPMYYVRSTMGYSRARRVGGWDSLPAGRGVTGGKGIEKPEGSGFLSLHTSQAKLAIDNRS